MERFRPSSFSLTFFIGIILRRLILGRRTRDGCSNSIPPTTTPTFLPNLIINHTNQPLNVTSHVGNGDSRLVLERTLANNTLACIAHRIR